MSFTGVNRTRLPPGYTWARTDQAEDRVRNLSTLVVGIAVLLCAGACQAIQAGATGQIGIRFLNVPPVPITTTSAPVTLNGTGGFGLLTQLDIPAGKFQIDAGMLDVTDPASAPVKGVQATLANDAGAFQGVGGAGFSGVMAIQGVAKVCLFTACPAALANLSIPLAVVGAAGTDFATAAVNLTVQGAPWTSGTALIGTNTAMGSVGPAPNTASPGGHIQLVSPIYVSTNIGAFAVVPVFATMDLTIPEPGQLVLMSASIAGLAACGIAKRRRREGSAPSGTG